VTPSLDRIKGNDHIAKANAPPTKKTGTRGGTSIRRKSCSPLGMESYVVRKFPFLDGGEFTMVSAKKIRGDPYKLKSS
jgi:hypothetical protein